MQIEGYSIPLIYFRNHSLPNGQMMKLKKTYILLGFILFLLFIQMTYSTDQVVIKFLYDDVSDITCPSCFQKYIDDIWEKNRTLELIQANPNYTSKVSVEWIEFSSDAGSLERVNLYNLYNITVNTPNSIVITDGEGNFTLITDNVLNTTLIEQVIDAYLAGSEPPPPSSHPSLMAAFATAFTFGFLETFSPCLIALLSFLLSFTIGESTQFKQSLLQVMTFGIGFVSSALLLGFAVGFLFLSFAHYSILNAILMWIICIFAILFGINLLGFDFFKFLHIKIETKSIVKELSRKYALTHAGLLLLGLLFYFLDPCLAPVFVSTLPLFLSEYLIPILFVFGLGVITPFIGIGLLAGSISKLARSTYRHKTKIRAISGLILIGYSLYLIIIYLL
jgi:cytochrome c biogenesis protein CcdA